MAVKKIAFVLGSMGRGGAERVISILSRDYARNGWETDIYMLLSAKTEYTLDPSTRVHDITGGNGSRLSRLPFWLKSIRQLAKKENPDVILSFAARINVIVLLACLGLHKNIAVSERSDPKHDNRGAAGKLLTSLLYPRAATVILQTKRSQSYFRKAVRKKCRIIPNPVEVSTLAGDTDENKIVAVGSLREVKNHAMLIKAFEKVVERYPDRQLTIYGEGELRAQLEGYAEELGIKDSVHLPGNVTDVHERMKDAAMFVLSSNHEGLSNALLEAMMMGIACISTDCAGSDEYITDGQSGLLTPVGDTDALAAAMIRFIEDGELRKRCAEGGKVSAQAAVTENVLKLWHEAIDG